MDNAQEQKQEPGAAQPAPPSKPVILSIAAASRRFDVPRSTLIQWIEAGKLTPLYDRFQRVVIAHEVEAAVRDKLEGKPQASEVLGDFVRGDEEE